MLSLLAKKNANGVVAKAAKIAKAARIARAVNVAKMCKIVVAVWTMLLIVFTSTSLTGCADTKSEQGAKYNHVTDFKGVTIGSQTGTMFDQILNGSISDLHFKYYDDISGQILALRNGDIDAVGLDEPVAKLVATQNKDFVVLPEVVQTDTYGMPMAKNGELTDQVSDIISEYEQDGTLNALQEKWFSGDSERMKINMNEYKGYDAPNGVLRFMHDSTQVPMSFVDDNGDSSGYEVELVLKIGKALGKKVEMKQANFSALITGVSSGIADIAAGCISITDERRESVDFPMTHYRGGIVLLCRKTDVATDVDSADAVVAADEATTGFLASLSESFQKTFVRENRWRLILSGLLITLLISICAFIFGTILGFLICLLRKSKRRAIARVTAAFIRIVQGIPLVVLLMVLYYVVFASANLSGVVVAIIGFALNFGVNSAEMMRSGIDAVDRGQWEAAKTLGFSKVNTFVKIVLPQAIQHFMPPFKGEFISMMKMTSVVGYIAVQDLTKASDIIRSRTYDALFPLIASALIYFLLAWGLTALIGLIEIKTDPKKRVRKLRGVDTSKRALPEKATQAAPQAAPKAATVHPITELIRIESLKKVYPEVTPLSNVNASINTGDVISVIGPSGTGKSTLLRLINELETPTSGKVVINKAEIRMGMVFQNFCLFPHITVVENIMLAPVCVAKMTRQEAYTRAMELLKLVGLAEKAMAYPDELSGGQKQRVAIARMLAMEPDILLFDEPTSALDPTMVAEVLSVIRSLARRGLTMLIVTHEMSFARDVSSRVFYMDEGEIYESGSSEQVFGHPQKEKTRRFIRGLRVLEETIESTEFDFIGVNSRMEEFGRKHSISQKGINAMQVAFEELGVQIVLPRIIEMAEMAEMAEMNATARPTDTAGSTGLKMNLLVEASDDMNAVTLYLRYNGEEFNPNAVVASDEISMQLVHNVCKEIQYSWRPKEELQNELALTLNT